MMSILALGAVTTAVSLLAGCDVNTSLGGPEKPEFKSLLVAGSSGLLPYTEALAKACEKAYPGMSVRASGGASRAAMIAIHRDVIDIAVISRYPTESEDNPDVRSFLIGRLGIAAIVPKSNHLQGLSTEQVRDILTGRVTDWSQVGGAPCPLHLYMVPPTPESDLVGESFVPGQQLAHNRTIVANPRELMIRVATDPGGVGGVPYLLVPPQLHTLEIDGVAPTRATISSGRYPLTRSFYFVLLDDPDYTEGTFLNFVLSPAGQDILEHFGILRVR